MNEGLISREEGGRGGVGVRDRVRPYNWKGFSVMQDKE